MKIGNQEGTVVNHILLSINSWVANKDGIADLEAHNRVRELVLSLIKKLQTTDKLFLTLSISPPKSDTLDSTTKNFSLISDKEFFMGFVCL